jgi:hypothetical protein
MESNPINLMEDYVRTYQNIINNLQEENNSFLEKKEHHKSKF